MAHTEKGISSNVGIQFNPTDKTTSSSVAPIDELNVLMRDRDEKKIKYLLAKTAANDAKNELDIINWQIRLYMSQRRATVNEKGIFRGNKKMVNNKKLKRSMPVKTHRCSGWCENKRQCTNKGVMRHENGYYSCGKHRGSVQLYATPVK